MNRRVLNSCGFSAGLNTNIALEKSTEVVSPERRFLAFLQVYLRLGDDKDAAEAAELARGKPSARRQTTCAAWELSGSTWEWGCCLLFVRKFRKPVSERAPASGTTARKNTRPGKDSKRNNDSKHKQTLGLGMSFDCQPFCPCWSYSSC